MIDKGCGGHHLFVEEVRKSAYDMTAYLWRKDRVPMIYSLQQV